MLFGSLIYVALTLLVYINATPTRIKRDTNEATNKILKKDDFTSNYAVDILRRAKVAEINAILNTKVKPCDDFYQYSCGNWHHANPAQLLGNIITDKFQMLSKAFNRRLEILLEEPKRGDFLEYKIKNFYQACRVVKDDLKLYQMDLDNVYKEFGEMPVKSDSEWQKIKDDFDWVETVAKIHNKYGKQIIIELDIMSDVKNNTKNRIYLGPPDFNIVTNTKIFSVLQEASTAMGLQQELGISAEAAKLTAQEIISFERKLVTSGTNSRFGLSLEELLVEKSITDLQETYAKHFDVRKYLELALGTTDLPEAVYIYDETYIEAVFQIISKTPKSTLANYIFWQLLQEFLVDSKRDELPKWCIEKTKKYFGKYVDYAVYQRYKSSKNEEEVMQMWEDIRDAFRDELQGDKLDWISNTTREYAIEKLDTMELHINSYENEDFNATYESLSIDHLNYVKNVQNILMRDSQETLKALNGPSKTIEVVEVLSFTPAYNVLDNTIKIPVAILQPRYFWDVTYPQAIKYATLGHLIAHEMIHGFDTEGRKYDKHGKQLDWWDDKSAYGFEEGRKCFQAQYHKYKYGGENLPESQAQSENIADNAAVKLAYKAYMRWRDMHKNNDAEETPLRNETLPGLDMNSSQLFFVSFAQVWCDDVQTLFKTSLTESDTHAPSMYRVIGTLSNFQEFSWVFRCPQDAPMDPEYKCAIY